MNQVNGSDILSPGTARKYYRMYDSLTSADRSFICRNSADRACGEVVTKYFCYPNQEHGMEHSDYNSENNCQGVTCEAYGDAHIWSFTGFQLESEPNRDW